jgi:2-C-methyl-D-erythritol 4-phosphate cytidylyltransferase
MFRRGELTSALQSAKRLGRFCTDDANALELSGKNPLLVEGSDENLKVTSASDLALAEAMLAGRLKMVS